MLHFFRLVLRRLFRHPPELARLVALSVGICAFGAFGFLHFEGPANPELTWVDAIWYALVTVTTVGYGDYYPATVGGRYLVAFPLMILGIGLLGYVVTLTASKLVESKSRALKGLGSFSGEGHLLIFNYPSSEKIIRILDQLEADRKFIETTSSVVLIDQELEQLPPELEERNVRYIRGAPARDSTLQRANADAAASALILAKPPGDPRADALNLTITLSLEARAPAVHSVVECTDPDTEDLLRKAGCDGIACTARHDAHFISQELLDPGLGEILGQLMSNLNGQQVYITPIVAQATNYGELRQRCHDRGHIGIGVRRQGRFELNPPPDIALGVADALVSIGPSRLANL